MLKVKRSRHVEQAEVPILEGKPIVLQLALVLFTVTVLASPLAEAAAPVDPAPFSATYSARYRGFRMGNLRYALRSPEPGKFIYESRAEPRLIARLFVSDDAIERSVMHIDAAGVRPLQWFREDGKSGEKEDGVLTFDWEDGRVRGTVEEDPVDLPTEPGLQDSLSFLIAIQTALLRGHEPETFAMVDGDRIKHYHNTRLGMDKIKTEAGAFSAVIFEISRPGSDRVSRVWYAPSLDYLPIRAEQERDGRVESVLELIRVKGRPVVRPEIRSPPP